MLITDTITPEEFYNKGLNDRSSYEDRAEKYAKLTIPALFREEGTSGTDALPDEYVQSLGAKLVKSMTSQIGMSAFPPASTSFALTPDSQAMIELTQGDPKILSDIYRATSFGQDTINKHLDAMKTRRMAFMATDQAVVVGSCVVEKRKDKGYKIFNLRSFVVQLNDMGEADAVCVVEELRHLPDGVEIPKEEKEKYTLYTMVEVDHEAKDKWVMRQMLEGEYVGDEKSYTSKTVPFKYLGWAWSQGEAYHRGFVEDNYGDLNSYNNLTKVLTQGSIIASKSLTFVDERGGRTKMRDVSNSANGDIIQGRADDVTSFQHGKNFDFQVPQQVRTELSSQLGETFMVPQFRDAERVTAEEIQARLNETEKSLVSPYVMFNQGMIEATVNWAIDDLKIEFNEVNVDIIAGVDALGRSAEAQKLDLFMQRADALGVRSWIKDEEILNRYARFENIDTVNLLKTEEEVSAEMDAARQAQTQQATQDQMGQEVAKGAGQAMAQGGQPSM